MNEMIDSTFRKATIADIDVLADLAYALNLYHNDNTKPISQKLKNDWDHYDAYVIEKNNQIIAFLAGYPFYEFYSSTRCFEIQDLYVLEEHRNHGVGQHIVNTVCTLQKQENGIERICVNAALNNKGAMSFYEKLSFHPETLQLQRYSLQSKND